MQFPSSPTTGWRPEDRTRLQKSENATHGPITSGPVPDSPTPTASLLKTALGGCRLAELRPPAALANTARARARERETERARAKPFWRRLLLPALRDDAGCEKRRGGLAGRVSLPVTWCRRLVNATALYGNPPSPFRLATSASPIGWRGARARLIGPRRGERRSTGPRRRRLVALPRGG